MYSDKVYVNFAGINGSDKSALYNSVVCEKH